MRSLLPILLTILALSLCSCDSKISPSGNPSDVLSAELYNNIQAKYSDVFIFEYGTAVVRSNQSYGLINYEGSEIMPCIYDSIFMLIDNTRIVKLKGKIGMVDLGGEFIIKCEYDDVYYNYRKAKYIPLKRNNKWGFVDNNGNIKIPFKYDEIEQVTDSVIVLNYNGLCGLMDYNENVIIDFKYDWIVHKPFDNTVSFVKSNNKIGIVNSANEIVTECIYDSWSMPKNGYLKLSKGKSDSYRTGYCGLVNCETGEEVIPFEYESLGNYSDGLIMAEKNDKYGFINITNKTVIPFTYDGANNFSEGKALVHRYSGYANTTWGTVQVKKSGYINTRGDVVIPIKFDDQELSHDAGFSEGLAVMGIGINNIFANKFGYIDTTGKFVIEPLFNNAEAFENGVAEVEINDKIGFINKKGDFIIQCIYDSRDYGIGLGDSIIWLVKDNKSYHFDYKGGKKEGHIPDPR